MKRYYRVAAYCFFICLLSVLTYVVYQANIAEKKLDLVFQEQRIIRFNYEIANQTAYAIQDAQFSTYLPVSLLANQRIKIFKASREYSENSDSMGNRVGLFNLDVLPPFGKKQLTLTAVVETAVKPNEISLEDRQPFLVSEPYIEVNHPKIISLAKELQGETPLHSMQNIFHWVSTQIEYAGYVSKDKGAVYALEHKKGDCTEYAYLVVALARALDIPARAIGGYVYENNAIANAADYHNWAEAYWDGRWHIIDAQNKNFMKLSQNYIAMRVISESKASLLGSSHRFSLAQDGLSVKLL